MDAMTFIDHMVGHLQWPLIVLIILLSFRPAIQKKVQELIGIKAGPAGFQAEFRQVLDQAMTAMAAEPVPAPTDEITEDRRRLQRIAAVSPRAAVLEAFTLVDNATKDRLREIGVPGAGQTMRSTQAIMAAQSLGLLGPAEVTVWNNLRTLSNTVRHQVDVDLSTERAFEYVRLASDLRSAVEQAPAPIFPPPVKSDNERSAGNSSHDPIRATA